MDSRRILITGANGFVGRHLIAYLAAAYGGSVTVTAGVRPAEMESLELSAPQSAGWNGQAGPNIEPVPMDILDSESLTGAIQRARPDHIVHLAARSSGADPDREAVLQTNVEGTRNVLEAASSLKVFPRTLVVSTGYVYGSTRSERPAREEDPIGPLWRFGAYTDSKIEMESVARNYRAFAMVARAFAHTGPGQSASFALPGFASQLVSIEGGATPPVLRVGNLDAERDLLDVRDVVRAYDLLLMRGAPGEVYNVSTGAPTTIGRALERMRRLCRVESRIEVDPQRLRPAEIACSTGDFSKAQAAVGWIPRISLDQTVEDMLEYWRALRNGKSI